MKQIPQDEEYDEVKLEFEENNMDDEEGDDGVNSDIEEMFMDAIGDI
jgi:hypothetical protein